MTVHGGKVSSLLLFYLRYWEMTGSQTIVVEVDVLEGSHFKYSETSVTSDKVVGRADEYVCVCFCLCVYLCVCKWGGV